MVNRPLEALNIVNCVFQLPELQRSNVARDEIVNFWKEAQKLAPVVKCVTNGANDNNDNKMARHIKTNQGIPIPFRVMAVTSKQLRFLVFNSRKWLCGHSFHNMDQSVCQPVCEWLTEQDGVARVITSPRQVS